MSQNVVSQASQLILVKRALCIKMFILLLLQPGDLEKEIEPVHNMLTTATFYQIYQVC